MLALAGELAICTRRLADIRAADLEARSRRCRVWLNGGPLAADKNHAIGDLECVMLSLMRQGGGCRNPSHLLMVTISLTKRAGGRRGGILRMLDYIISCLQTTLIPPFRGPCLPVLARRQAKRGSCNRAPSAVGAPVIRVLITRPLRLFGDVPRCLFRH